MKRLLILLLLLFCRPSFGQISETCAGTGSLSGFTQYSAGGFTTITRVAGVCTATASTQGMVASTTSLAADQQAEITIVNDIGGAVCVRMDASLGNGTCYIPAIGFIYNLAAGGGAGPVAGSCGSAVATDVIKLKVAGDFYAAYKNGTLVCSGHDTTYTSGEPGVYLDQRSATTSGFTNFVANVATALSASPNLVGTSSTTSITLTGVGTAWTPGTPGAPTFTVSNSGSSCTIASQVVASTTSATISLVCSTGGGHATITDPSTGETADIEVHAPQTYYFNASDGGTSVQCDGLTNVAQSGSTGGHCRLKHPFYMLTDNTSPTPFSWSFVNPVSGFHFTGGDTMQFTDAGPYYIGQTLNGLGTNWAECAGDEKDCVFPRGIPSGTSTMPTKILGMGHGACHNTYPGGLVNATQWRALNGAFYQISFQNAQWLDFECIDMSQIDTCTTTATGANVTTITNTQMSGGVARYDFTSLGSGPNVVANELISVAGTTNGGGVFNFVGKNVIAATYTTPYSVGFFTVAIAGTVSSAADTGQQIWAGNCVFGTQNYGTTGIEIQAGTNQGPTNTTMKDISIHGLSTGLKGSHFNLTSGDTFTASDIYMDGNGGANWDSDGGGCGISCESVGTMNISNVYSVWAGCQEVIGGGGTHDFCSDFAFNGSGDNIVMIATQGTWNWTDIYTAFCTQDCIDFLHMGDDIPAYPTVNVLNIKAINAEGQSIKGGGGHVSFINCLGVGNGAWPLNGTVTGNPLGWNAMIGGTHRANDSMAFAMADGDTLTIDHCNNFADNPVSWDFAAAGSGNCTTNCIIQMHDNATLGFIDNLTGDYSGPVNIGTTNNPFANPSSSITNNSWYNIKTAGVQICPGEVHETAYVCTPPLFVDDAAITSIDAHLTASSPLIGTGITLSGQTHDLDGVPWAAAPAIGVYEYPTTFGPQVIGYGIKLGWGMKVH